MTFDNCGTEEIFEVSQTKRDYESDMDAALASLDDSYAEYLLNERQDLGIDNGDMLAAAMEAGIAWPDFLESRK
jgi:hypothetical protein